MLAMHPLLKSHTLDLNGGKWSAPRSNDSSDALVYSTRHKSTQGQVDSSKYPERVFIDRMHLVTIDLMQPDSGQYSTSLLMRHVTLTGR
jgi:hypothetical protein